MKVTILNRDTETWEKRDYKHALHIYVSSESEDVCMKFRDGEPEDNNISRNFSDIFLIKDLIKIAYNAGKNGEELEIIEKEIDEI